MKRKATVFVLMFIILPFVSGAPTSEPADSTPVSRAIALIHHLTYLIDYLVQYVLGRAHDRKTPPEAADYYRAALVEGKNPPGQDANGLKPDNGRARQETEIIQKMMRV
uniref:Salivary secreted peptide n=1 Tax=Anopheles dirus TaxID=7168 RepID=A0A182N9E8_9DIPT